MSSNFLLSRPSDAMSASPNQSPFHSKDNIADSVEQNKKRKLQYDLENLVLPLSKHKFRDRFRTSNHVLVEETDDMQNWNEEMATGGLRDESVEKGESYNDSNSVSEGYDTTMTLDLDDEAEKSSAKSDSASVSCSNLKNGVCVGNIDYFYNETVKECNIKQDIAEPLQFESGGNGREEKYPELEDMEKFDAGSEELLYSNGMPFFLPSKRWMLGAQQENGSTARKPTIDKEFEQYFSMLML